MNHKSLVFAAALGFAGAADATLIDRGGGLIYDDVLNITWLQNANYGAGSSYDNGFDTTDGRMTWQNAFDWADNLTYYDSVRNVTYDDWRLPITTDTGIPGCNFSGGGTDDCGYNVQTANTNTTPVTVYSELAYIYHVNLGLKSYWDTSGAYQSNWGIFGNGTRNGTDNTSFGQNDVGLIDNLQSSVYWFGIDIPFMSP